MPRPTIARILQITVGLSILGAVVGGALGALLVAMLAARVGGFGGPGELLLTGSAFGAAMGAALAPLAAWTLMRHVPLWRAVSETAIGTVLGASVGLILQPMHDVAWLSPVYLGVVGFVLAGLRLRFAVRGRASLSEFDVLNEQGHR